MIYGLGISKENSFFQYKNSISIIETYFAVNIDFVSSYTRTFRTWELSF